MSTNSVTVTSTARRRIGTFSVWVWVWGAVVLCIGAFTTYSDVGFGDGGFGMLGDGDNPWEVADPPVFEPDGTTYSGDGSGLIRIPLAEHNQDPYLVNLRTDETLDLFVTEAVDIGRPDDDRGYPDNIAYLYDAGDEALIIPADAELELWVRSDTAWEFTLVKAEVAEITDGFASGTGNGFFAYHGDALSARFVHKGDGVFFVTIQTTAERSDQPIIESGEVDQRVSWDPTDAVYFTVEADDGRGAWSIDIDELAADAPVEPEPATPGPTDSPAPVAGDAS